jgi:hypothetical protein
VDKSQPRNHLGDACYEHSISGFHVWSGGIAQPVALLLPCSTTFDTATHQPRRPAPRGYIPASKTSCRCLGCTEYLRFPLLVAVSGVSCSQWRRCMFMRVGCEKLRYPVNVGVKVESCKSDFSVIHNMCAKMGDRDDNNFLLIYFFYILFWWGWV